MALVKCKECGEQISDKATACPKCGAGLPKKTSFIGWIIFCFIVVIAWTACSKSRESYQLYSAKAKAATKPDPSPDTYRSQPKDSVKKEPPAPPSWSTYSSADEMTGKVWHVATSPSVSPTEPMGFPYADVMSWITVGCNKESIWAYFSFSQAPNIANDETKSGYNLISTRIKWGENVSRVKLTQNWGGSAIHFQEGAAAIAKLRASSTVMLELDWYGQLMPRFSYSLNGSSAAISEIMDKCRK